MANVKTDEVKKRRMRKGANISEKSKGKYATASGKSYNRNVTQKTLSNLSRTVHQHLLADMNASCHIS